MPVVFNRLLYDFIANGGKKNPTRPETACHRNRRRGKDCPAEGGTAIGSLIDTHCHLDDERFAGDLDDVLARMRAAGVAEAVTVGTDPAGCRWAAHAAGTRPGLFAAVGFHPTEAGRPLSEDDWSSLAALARAPRVVAVGETGLDWRGDRAPRDAQRAHFSRHIAIARAAGKPLVIHCREAYPDCLAQLRAEGAPPVRGLFHCFSGTPADARAALDLGMLLSFAAPVGYPGSHELRETARFVPADRFVVETDAPWLPPQSRRGERNEPAFVTETVDALARARGEPRETVALRTTENARALFGIAL
jgi:TatD DNase family protein